MKCLFQQFILSAYLVITLSGFLYTLFRIHTPLVPWIFTRWSYMLMAPYQGYATYNEDIIAEGQRADGTWEVIDLSQYFPYILGETNVRLHMRSFRYLDDPDLFREKFTLTAKRLLMLEQRGKPYTALRLSYIRWPIPMRGGYAFNRHEPFLEKEVITEVSLHDL